MSSEPGVGNFLLHGNHESESQHGPKEVAMRTPEERIEALRKLKQEPLFQGAAKAYRKLAKEGCDMRVLMGQVGRVAGYKSGNKRRAYKRPAGQAISRKIRSMNRQLRKLARRAAELRGIWGFWEHMADAHALRVPEELQNIAGRLSCICTEGFGEWFPQREAIMDLLEHVRTSTGRPHYTELSLLINVELIWHDTKNGREIRDMVFDPESLKMIFKRYNQRQAAVAKKRSATNKEAESLKSVEYSLEQMWGIGPVK